jgi:hypothetical protein
VRRIADGLRRPAPTRAILGVQRPLRPDHRPAAAPSHPDPAMRLAILPLFLLSGCVMVTGTLRDEDCLPTWGDHCGCGPQCMTARQISRIDTMCDMDCPPTTWECFSDGRTCFVDAEEP